MLNIGNSIKEQVYLTNARSVQNLLNQTFFSNILIMLFTILCYQQATAQEIKEVKEVVARLDTKNAERLNSLMYDLQTTIYLENGEMKIFGDGMPVYVKADVHSIKKMSEKNSKFSQVEFLQVNLNELGDEAKVKLTPATISGLSNLKYILVRSSYELNKAQFEKIISSFDGSGITILYEVSIPN